MTPNEFIAKWQASELKERSAAQEHFIDLCRLLGEPTPAEADPRGEHYCFERGARKDSGGEGWADVWKRHCFAWEYKGKHADLDAAFDQLRQYALALENPPLLIVSDMRRFRIRTNWTNSVSKTLEIGLDDLVDAAVRDRLKWAMSDPERLRPGETRQTLTERAARTFAQLAQSLREAGHAPQGVAHFVNRLVFCMFAEDVGLLPGEMFTRMLQHARQEPEEFATLARDLFGAMSIGGRVGFETVEWFNGGLFEDDATLPMDRTQIETTLEASELDWSNIDPSILGTLFERGLDPDKRSQLGAHYTDRDKIMRIIDPVIVRPWLVEWESARAGIASSLERANAAKSKAAATRHRRKAENSLGSFLERLRKFTVLDPACGSGNFLYLALHALHDLEHRVQLEAEALGLQRAFPSVGPANVKGIELNAYAAELARVSVWIGEIQWMRRNGFPGSREPVLDPLETIECRDAILTSEGGEPEWPEADVIIGNPPFLGGKRLITNLGEEYVSTLFRAYDGRVPRQADLVCYWFVKAGELLGRGVPKRVGLVATNSIRGGANRRALERATDGKPIFDAWSDEPWVIDGAAVRVSLVCFSEEEDQLTPERRLDDESVDEIYTDLTARRGDAGVDLTNAGRLARNAGVAFMGDTKGGPFDIPGDLAREWLREPTNPNGRPNSDVLAPWMNGVAITRRSADKWIVDFGVQMPEGDAALYEAPFQWVKEHVRPTWEKQRVAERREHYHLHHRPRPRMRRALDDLSRYIATPRVSKHRLFVWFDIRISPNDALIAIAREDDTTFGILHSRFHEAWSLRTGTWLGAGNDPRYTPTTTFETFPFPEGLSPDVPASDYLTDPRAQAIASAARRLVDLRERWLNPPELVEWIDEPVAGYPPRPAARDDKAASAVKKAPRCSGWMGGGRVTGPLAVAGGAGAGL
ncbi:class I SAM-dependent DNA methyltransferase [Candidatus Palauibacter sp.]|uniref:class I SAM-dependent DNA methyltransferase n=1 Tax=Candidatus Palauibacter sp. TaxID=3101350 RepID=UPI003B018922